MKKLIKSILLSLFVTLLAAGVVYAVSIWSKTYRVAVNEPIQVTSSTDWDLGSMYVGGTKTIDVVVENFGSMPHVVTVTVDTSANLVVTAASSDLTDVTVYSGGTKTFTVVVKAIDPVGDSVVENTVLIVGLDRVEVIE